MRTIVGLLAVLLAIPCQAQVAPRKTEIKGHILGETIAEFLSRAGWTDELDTCRAKAATLSPTTIYGERNYLSLSTRCNDLMNLADADAGEHSFIFTIPGDHNLGFDPTFYRGKLAKASITLDGTYNEVRPKLVKKYGRPVAEENISFQNAFGTRWTGVLAQWFMPDGGHIVVRYRWDFASTSGVFIDFKSKEQDQRELREKEPLSKPFD